MRFRGHVHARRIAQREVVLGDGLQRRVQPGNVLIVVRPGGVMGRPVGHFDRVVE